ncbi:MAG: hypothetical protein A2293_15820 [Elusimicrobia bacterium RIFOXYB2_FULL_49_7]|nr:MAG: hypothetical protein A2293_15820 [Elusimicrobia bacterium RIFOXYB2_FULL_49_7]
MAVNEQERGHRLIKNSLLNILNSLITLGVTSITSVVIARTLKPSQYGIYNLVLWCTGIFVWIAGLGLIHVVTKYIAEYRGRGQGEVAGAIVSFVLRIELVLTIVLTAVLLFFKTEIADYFFSPQETFYFMLAFIGILPGIISAIFSSAIEGIQKFEYFTWFHVIVGPLAFAAKMATILMGYRIDGLLCVSLFFSFINVLFYYIILKREKIALHLFGGPKLSGEIKGKIRRYNWTVAGIMVSSKIVWDKSENLFLGRFCSAEQIGYYNLGYNVAQRFMSILPDTFWKVLFPAMSGYFGSGDQDKIKRVFFLASRYLAFISFPVGVAGIVLAYPIIHYLYGDAYAGAKYVFQIFFFSTMITSLSKPGSAILYGTERQSFILKYGLVLAVINLGLNFLIIPSYGAMGAAFCCALVTMAGSIGGLIYTCRTVRLTYPFQSVFKIIFSSIIMGICMKMVISQKAALFGFIFSIPLGAIIYMVSATVLGSFEEEDYILMNKVKSVLPLRLQNVADSLIIFLSSFKTR